MPVPKAVIIVFAVTPVPVICEFTANVPLETEVIVSVVPEIYPVATKGLLISLSTTAVGAVVYVPLPPTRETIGVREYSEPPDCTLIPVIGNPAVAAPWVE